MPAKEPTRRQPRRHGAAWHDTARGVGGGGSGSGGGAAAAEGAEKWRAELRKAALSESKRAAKLEPGFGFGPKDDGRGEGSSDGAPEDPLESQAMDDHTLI